MHQGKPCKHQRYAAQWRQHRQFRTEIRSHQHEHHQYQRRHQGKPDRLKLATKTSRVIQHCLPVTTQHQGQHTDGLQQCRYEAVEHRCDQAAQAGPLLYRQLLVETVEHLRQGFFKRSSQSFDRFAEHRTQNHAIHQAHGDAEQQHPVPGLAGAQQRSQPQRPQQHHQGARLAEEPPGQRRQ
ncbi:hypothetical protein D9M71_557730 [compost metagenome]